ncbi:hypothetical protein ACQJBY_031653 [Aegilops geniculata]
MIYPVPGEHDWTRTSGPDIEPPKFHVKKGRRKEKRIKGKFEVPKPKDSSRMATITCSNCGLQGHRYTNCKQQLRPEFALRKNKHVAPARSRNEDTPSGSQQPPARSVSARTTSARTASARSASARSSGARSATARSTSRSARVSASASARFARPFTAPRFVVGASSSGPSTSGAPSSVRENYTRLMSFFTASGNT